MNNLSPERRRVVVLFACVGCMSGAPILAKGHPVILGVWLAFMAVILVYAMKRLLDLKRQGL